MGEVLCVGLSVFAACVICALCAAILVCWLVDPVVKVSCVCFAVVVLCVCVHCVLCACVRLIDNLNVVFGNGTGVELVPEEGAK